MDNINIEDFYNELVSLDKELEQANSKVNANSKVESSYINFLNKVNAYNMKVEDVQAIMGEGNASKKTQTNEDNKDSIPFIEKIKNPLHDDVNNII